MPVAPVPSPLEGTDVLLVGIGELATPRGSAALPCAEAGRVRVIKDAFVAGRQGFVTHVGRRRDLPARLLASSETRVIDAGGGAVLPGFIDAHTHAVHAGAREDEFRLRLAGESYVDIAARGGGILATVAATRRATREELAASLGARLDGLLRGGVTTAEVKSGYGLDVATELRLLEVVRDVGAGHPVEVVPTYLGAHSVPVEHRANREAYLRLVRDEALPAVAAARLAEFCDVFCEASVFTPDEARPVLLRARDFGLQLKVHADELAPSGAAELAGEVGAVSAEHLMKASDEGLAALASAGTVAVLLPGTSLFLREPYAAADRFRRAGCAVAVATDLNPGTCPTDNLPLVAFLGCVGCGLSPEEALTAITLNAAAAVSRAGALGSLEPGKRFDAVVLREPRWLSLLCRFGTDVVRHVVKGGRLVVRDGVRAPAQPA